MKADELQKHIVATYLFLRIGVALIAIAFPLILWIGGRIIGVVFPDEISMSAYYYATPVDSDASLRDWFVGLLFALGVFLFLYRGFSKRENLALDLAGIFAIGVAIFPLAWPGKEGLEYNLLGFTFSVHGTSAVLLFLSIAYVSIKRASDTLHLVKDAALRARYRSIYRAIGVGMIVLPAAIFLLRAFVPGFRSYIFYAEALGIWVFATYWLVKSRELSSTKAETLALFSKLEIRP